MLLVAWHCFSCNLNAPNPNKVQNHVKVETEIALAVDSLFISTGNAELDSLLKLAAVTQQDTNLAKLYFEIANHYRNNDFEKSGDYYFKLKNLSDRLDWNRGRYLFTGGFSNLLNLQGLTDSAIVINQQAIELAKKENNEQWLANAVHRAGLLFNNKSWYETAMSYFMEALSIFEKTDDKESLGQLYYMIGMMYRNLNNKAKSIEYCEKAFAITPDDPFIIVNLAEAYHYDRQFEKAKKHYKEVLQISERQNNMYLIGAIYSLLGSIALELLNWEEADAYLQKSWEINQKIGNYGMYSENLFQLSRLEELKGHFALAEKYIQEAIQIAIGNGDFEEEKRCYMVLSELSIAQHNYRQSMQCWQKIDSIESALTSQKTLFAVEELSAKYENTKKELEIENQKQIIARQNIERGLLASGIALSMVILFLLWHLLRLRNHHNISLMERNDALKERNDALAEMNATKDKFFNIISHDIKNPATAQRDALKRLVKNALLWDADTLAKYYNSLLESAEGQVELVYNLLGWAQLQTGRMIFQPVTFNLAASLRSDISLIRSMAEKKGITFAAQIPEDADVTCDSNMITAVVRNLLSNAVKFTPAGGMVSLVIARNEAIQIPISTSSPVSPCFSISVSDTGIGMSQEQIDNLFRLDVTHSRRGTAGEQGSGLGLIVCKELLEKHNTVLHVESEVGKGSRFWFTI